MNTKPGGAVIAVLLLAGGLWYLNPEQPTVLAEPAAEKTDSSGEPSAPSAQDTADREHRAELRAYYGAPPVIPHDSAMMQDSNCAFCHSAERELPNFDRLSPQSPHPYLERCSQCHMASEFPLGGPDQVVATSWKGLEEPGEGHRANPLAPPVMPHELRMRENCLSCHSAQSPYIHLRCPHPERVSCQQCHVPDAQQVMPVDLVRAMQE